MIYLKSAVVGVLVAMAAAVLFVLVTFVLPIAVPFMFARASGTGGVGSASATLDSGPLLLVMLVGFAAGSYWTFRRSKRVR